ncbi:hypothetical protein C8R45DRAFT_1112556 [Mycena sanguinolenta]|nr:hypothetical protein C8R45DRAFT_1112556 [Mycena sanguinolenta]
MPSVKESTELPICRESVLGYLPALPKTPTFKRLLQMLLILAKRSLFLNLRAEETKLLNRTKSLLKQLPDEVFEENGENRTTLVNIARLALGREWDDHRRALAMCELAKKHRVGAFGIKDSDDETETDDERLADFIENEIPVHSDAPADFPQRPSRPKYSKDGDLHRFHNDILDNFFRLGRLAYDRKLSAAEKHDLYYYRVWLLVLEVDYHNDLEYSEILKECYSRDPNSSDNSGDNNDEDPDEDGAEDRVRVLVKSYVPTARRKYTKNMPPLFSRTQFGELAYFKSCSKEQQREIASFGPSKNVGSDEDPLAVISSDESESERETEGTSCPVLDPSIHSYKGTRLHNAQTALVPIARQVLIGARGRALTPIEALWSLQLLDHLRGHPSHGRIKTLFDLATKGKLRAIDLMDTRTMAGKKDHGADADDEGDVNMVDANSEDHMDVDEDEMDGDALLKQEIHDIGASAEFSGAILEKIQKRATKGIYIHPKPMYHASPPNRYNSTAPSVYGEGFGSVSEFLKTTIKKAGGAKVHVGLLIVAQCHTAGVKHETQLAEKTHAVVLIVSHGRTKFAKSLLVWDVNVLHTTVGKTKKTIDKFARITIRKARGVNKMPPIYSFWINKGEPKPHDDICLTLSLQKILEIATGGLAYGRAPDGSLSWFKGFMKVPDVEKFEDEEFKLFV